jgi:23S rRNA pseudouridine1911/1915/1917 synthase
VTTSLTLEIPSALDGQRVDKALAELAEGLSRERIKALLAAGQISGPAGAIKQGALKVRTGERYTVEVPPAAPLETPAQDLPLTIVFEDEHLIVLDKPAGQVVHPAAGNPDGTLVNALLHHAGDSLSGIGGVARPGIVHRIDKDTSGLLVVAKTDAAHQGLSAQFADHSIERLYTAIVAGLPSPTSGTIAGAIARSSQNRQKMALVEDGRGKHAITHYRTLRPLPPLAAVLECQLETGRTHQIRVHLTSIGHPLLGDPTYGRAGTRGRLKAILDAQGFQRQALHAGVLGFEHPVLGGFLRFESPLPTDLVTLIEALARG